MIQHFRLKLPFSLHYILCADLKKCSTELIKISPSFFAVPLLALLRLSLEAASSWVSFKWYSQIINDIKSRLFPVGKTELNEKADWLPLASVILAFIGKQFSIKYIYILYIIFMLVSTSFADPSFFYPDQDQMKYFWVLPKKFISFWVPYLIKSDLFNILWRIKK